MNSLVCLSSTNWEGDFQKSIVQLLTELAPKYTVLFVDYMFTFKDALSHCMGHKKVPMRKLLGLEDNLTKYQLENGSTVYVLTPPLTPPLNWLPGNLHDRLLPLNAAVLGHSIRKAMKRLKMEHPVLINAYNPTYGMALKNALNASAQIYYCYDEIAASKWLCKHGVRFESQYVQAVDAVITSSETLQMSKSKLQPNCFLVRNGANTELFRQAHSLRASVGQPVKTVGYLGTIDDRLDVPLLQFCFEIMPDVHFQFLGRVTDPAIRDQLAIYPNVTFVGAKKPQELARCMADMHVGIIPFVCNAHTYTIYPLKLNEYLAAGLPVVSTPFSILDDFKEIIAIAHTPFRFASALRDALAEDDLTKIRARMQLAAQNSWAHRAREFDDLIARTVARKTAKKAVLPDETTNVLTTSRDDS
ncbi:glycosyltransferase [Larkinella harenae]